MLDQSFSLKTLRGLVRNEDLPRYRPWRMPSEADGVLKRISERLEEDDYQYPAFQSTIHRGHKVYSTNNFEACLALRKVDENLRSIYKVRQWDRNVIVSQVKSLLMEQSSFAVVKADINSFFESVNRDELMTKLRRDSLLSQQTLRLLDRVFRAPSLNAVAGLPRGLPISSTLSELYLRPLDQKMVEDVQSSYFYARFVDDIVAFTVDDPAALRDIIAARCSERQLSLNAKLEMCRAEASRIGGAMGGVSQHFDFLGYRFIFEEENRKSARWRSVHLRMAEAKLKKLKSRIVKSLLAHGTHHDFDLLRDRLAVLSGNFPVSTSRDSTLMGGIFYSYPLLTDLRDMGDLTRFLRRLLFAQKGPIADRLKTSLTMGQRRQLAKFDFAAGWTNKIATRFSGTRMKNICECWRHENR